MSQFKKSFEASLAGEVSVTASRFGKSLPSAKPGSPGVSPHQPAAFRDFVVYSSGISGLIMP
jgi:hypothetical protein